MKSWNSDNSRHKTSGAALALLCLLGVLLAVLSRPATSSAAVLAGARFAAAGSPAEGSPIANLDGQVNTLGIFTYPDVYVGVAYADGDRGLTVYVAPGRDRGALEAAVLADRRRGTAAGGLAPQVEIHFVVEPMSITAFAPTMAYLKGDQSAADGLEFGGTHLDAPSDTLEVQLLKPTPSDLTALSRALTRATHADAPVLVTGAAFLADAGHLLQSKFGSHVRVTGYGAVLSPTADRLTNTSPWDAGQYIDAAEVCSDGWIGLQVHSGNYFMVTAGHCIQNGTGQEVSLYQNGAEVGIASHAFIDDNQDDVGSILMGSSVSVTPGVFGGTGYYQFWQDGQNSTTLYSYWNGPTAPGAGSQVTLDGAFSGEYRGMDVISDGGADDCFPSEDANKKPDKVCNVIEVDGGSDYPGDCYNGDSGGPIYVHDGSTSAMISVATLFALTGGIGGTTCYGELVSQEEKDMGLQLYQNIGPVAVKS